MKYSLMSREALAMEYEKVRAAYENYRACGLTLDLSRGKPNTEQLDHSQQMLNQPRPKEECFSESGIDCRNYGVLDGLPEMRRLFGDLLGITPERILIGGNSSLQMMYDALARAMLFGTPDSECPWYEVKGRKWLCVTPGYDRHFAITEQLGFEMINVPMTKDGPDMDLVEQLVRDPLVKGIWCVPKYSNPTGNTYSDATVRRLASMECAAPDFRIFWDNAYAVHDLGAEGDELLDIFAEAEKSGHLDRILCFCSTSKITFPGGGVAMLAASERNLADVRARMTVQTIGYDKLNQLRHVQYFGNAERVRAHMQSLGAMIRRKFDIALTELHTLDDYGIAVYTDPRGGYFISLDMQIGRASRVYELMREAGVVLTKVGATFPYGRDPEDKNLRVAPTYPSDEELRVAMQILCVTIRLAALESLLA